MLLLVLIILRFFGLASSLAGQTIAYFMALLSGIIGLTYVEVDSFSDNIFRAALYRSAIATGLFTASLLLGSVISGVSVPFGYWGAFVLAFLFLLLLGDLYIRATTEDLRYRLLRWDRCEEVKVQIETALRSFRTYQEYQYVSFFLAPIIAIPLYCRGVLSGHSLLQVHFIFAVSLIVICILVSLVVSATRLARPLRVPQNTTLGQEDAEELHKLSSEARTLYFSDMFHSLIVIAIYLTGFYLITTQDSTPPTTRSILMVSAIAFAGFAAIFLFLPYSIGQILSVRAIRRQFDHKHSKIPPHEIERHLCRIAPPFPSDVNTKFLVVSLTAGGALTALIWRAVQAL